LSLDSSELESLYVDEEYGGSETAQAFITHVENRLKELHTALPGIVQSYDATKNTVTVQPAIQRVFVKDGPKNLPLIEDVPAVFPGSGDFVITFPVKKGDECLLIFTERAIDYWYKEGGIQQPSQYRLHHLSDAVAIIGLRSQARNLSSINTDALEVRNADRSVYLQVSDSGIFIKGAVTVEGDITQTGKLTQTSGGVTTDGDVKSGSISLVDHVHTGVQTGGSDTGPATG
jgi:hypothetical protein